VKFLSLIQGKLQPWILPWVLGGAVFLLVVATTYHYGVGFDEPWYFYASDLKIQWYSEFFSGMFNGDLLSVLSDERIKAAWHWDPSHVPHPPFSRILSGVTRVLFSPFIDRIVAYRLSTALLFSLLVSTMYVWMASLFGRGTGLFSALTLILLPNLFGFAHIAVTDMPLAALWFVSVYCFWKGLKDWRWSVTLGVVWGLALSTRTWWTRARRTIVPWRVGTRQSYQ